MIHTSYIYPLIVSVMFLLILFGQSKYYEERIRIAHQTTPCVCITDTDILDTKTVSDSK